MSILAPERPELVSAMADANAPAANAPEAGTTETTPAQASAPAEATAAEASDASRSAAKDSDPAAASAKEVASGPASKSAKSSDAARFARQFKIPVPLAQQIHSAAVAEGIEPRVAFGLVQTESSFRRTAISSVGAVGYTQLLPSTANWIAPGTKRSDLFQTHTNLRVGFKYLNYLKDKYNGNMRLALTAYNRGPGTVDRLLKQGRNPENGYATKVLRGPRA
jgi:soluble lytic murein transglycosylase-like protein